MATTRTALSPAVGLSFAAFVLVGLSAGVGGVLIPAQIRDYGIDMATIGLTFVTFSAGFFLGGTSVGALVSRLGLRGTVLVGGAAYVAAGLVTATRPSFAVLVALQVVAGYGMGVLESVLMVHLSGLPSAASLLNRLHGFFGVGALLGPLLAARMLTAVPWTAVWLVLALLAVPLLAGLAWFLPSWVLPAVPLSEGRSLRDGMLARVLRQPAVMLAAVFLAVYVGLEISAGNWTYTYLVDGRGRDAIAAGYVVSGYWLGLTIGRFVISPLADRWGVSSGRMMLGCLGGTVVVALLTWVAPGAVVPGGFVLLGFFLGPLFPTAMALLPTLTSAAAVPTAIGVLNAVSVIGGSALPWLAGAIAQRAGIGVLLPYVAALGVLQLVLWQAAVRSAGVQAPEATSAV